MRKFLTKIILPVFIGLLLAFAITSTVLGEGTYIETGPQAKFNRTLSEG